MFIQMYGILQQKQVVPSGMLLYNTVGSDTFTIPSGVKELKIECWSGGGMGGTMTSAGGGGGGGGGAYACSIIGVTPGTAHGIFVGSGGSTVVGADGENTTFGDSLVVAAGGGGASGRTAGNGAPIGNSIGQVKYIGGNGYAGTVASVGRHGGGGAGSMGPGGDAHMNDVGVGSPEFGGDGGEGASVNGTPGNPGNACGGGGGGARRLLSGTYYGGEGGKGLMRLSWGDNIIPISILFTTTGSQNFVIPAGVTKIKVECWGGGGGGGTMTAAGGGGGGGGGAYAASILTVNPGETYTIYVGTKGPPNFDGYYSYFYYNYTGHVLVFAEEGKGAKGNTYGVGGSADNCIGTICYSGGNGVGGLGSIGSPGGGGAGSSGSGKNATITAPGGATSEYGGAGATRASSGPAIGNDGNDYGGGGGGAYGGAGTTGAGGYGAQGLVRISWGNVSL